MHRRDIDGCELNFITKILRELGDLEQSDNVHKISLSHICLPNPRISLMYTSLFLLESSTLHKKKKSSCSTPINLSLVPVSENLEEISLSCANTVEVSDNYFITALQGTGNLSINEVYPTALR